MGKPSAHDDASSVSVESFDVRVTLCCGAGSRHG
jgi:hypothetical protein